MNTPFFIDQIPDTAEYYYPQPFYKAKGEDTSVFVNRLQIEDYRLTDRFRSRQPVWHFPNSIIRTKDAIISKPVSPILCSTAIFKSRHVGTGERAWLKYINDLKEKIDYFETDSRFQLRVYLGDSMWDDLHHEDLLNAPNVDFIRMEDSSTGWSLGNMWRLLALTDYTYDYVFFDDVHLTYSLDFICDRIIRGFKETDCPISARLVEPPLTGKDPVTEHNFLIKMPFEWTSEISTHLFAPIVWSLPIEMFFKTKLFHWYRNPVKLPFSNIATVITECFNTHPLRKLYDPELNRWTYMQPHYQIFQDADATEKIMFFVSHLVDMQLLMHRENVEWCRRGYQRFGDNFFWKRLIEQMRCELKILNTRTNEITPFEWENMR